MQTVKAGDMQLEAIMVLEQESQPVRCIDIARYLKITRPNVTVCMQEQEKNGMIVKGKNGALSLTDNGREIALQIYERHRFFREWLLRAEVSFEDADEEARELARVIGPDSFEKLIRRYGKGNSDEKGCNS